MIQSLFGTDGIRASVGKEPLTLTSLPHLGYVLGLWAHTKYTKPVRMLIGHDTRISCSLVKASLKSGLLAQGVMLHDAGVIPSPAVMRIMNLTQLFDMGIIISASHNPYRDNGIKIILNDGKLTTTDEQEITELFYSTPAIYTYETLATDTAYPDAAQHYIDTMVALFSPQCLSGKTIVLDCANGAASNVAPAIFSALGGTIITINDMPNGYNINEQCGAVHPEQLQETVLNNKADIGFAFDGDADRVIAVNNAGEIKNGDDILAILLEHPLYKKTSTVVGTIMTNQGIEALAAQKEKVLVRTPVGDKFITDYLVRNNLLLGSEPSGHVILRDYLATGDGIFTALRIVETIQLNQNWSMHSFTKFPQIVINVPVQVRKDLTQDPAAHIITSHREQLNKGRIVVRYSGTEPLLRIMIEDEDQDNAKKIGMKLSQELQQAL